MWAKMLRPACAILMMCCCCFVLIYKSQCIMFTAVVGCAYDSKSSSGPTAVHRECVYLCWSPADLLCCSSDWLSGVLLSQLGFRLVDCLHRLLGRALLLAHGQENRERARERDGESSRVEKNSAKIESKERKDKEEWRRMEGERKQEKKKKWNISLNESLLAVSVSQPGGVGVLPQALHCSSLSIPPSPPLFCLCVCL